MQEILENIELNRYDYYKDSGVKWLDKIPSDWSIIRLKYISSLYNGNSLNDTQKNKYSIILSNDTIPYISSKDIDLEKSDINYNTGLSIPKVSDVFKMAPQGSSLLCIEGGSAGKKVSIVKSDVFFVNKLACFVPDTSIDHKYLFYSLRSYPFKRQFELSMTGMIGGVALSAIKNFFNVLPSLWEQQRISTFLDQKTLQIDQAIAKKNQLILLLQERRQIMIYRAVTQGLDPNPKMKDSGMEWIGEIPEHWELVANRSLFSERKESGNDKLPLLSVSIHSAVSSEEVEDNIQGRVKIEDKSKYQLVEVNDITFNMMRAWQGAIGAVRVKGMVSPAYVVAKPIKKINSHFFEYQHRTSLFIQQINRNSKGITDFRKRLYWSEFKQLLTVLPPLNEQGDIVEFVDKISNKIDVAINAQITQIERLKEYKTTLINSAVTGKMKV